jgi:hypothetical protein
VRLLRGGEQRRSNVRFIPHTPAQRGVAYLAVIAALAAALVVWRGADHGRRCPGGVGTDLSARSVSGGQLSQLPLRCANLERSRVTGSVREANLAEANLHRTQLRLARLENVDLSGADLTDAGGASAILDGVTLARADLRRANLQGSLLSNVSLQRARLAGADLRSVSLTRSDLSGANADSADLSDASLSDTNLRGARLEHAKLARAVWSNVVCPDGSKSAGQDRESCAGHLRPTR